MNSPHLTKQWSGTIGFHCGIMASAVISIGLLGCDRNENPALSELEGEPAGPRSVMVSRGPGKPWSPMDTRVLADLPQIPQDKVGTRYGGIVPEGGPLPASGFFRTTQHDGRWWLVDPEGNLFIHRGVSSVRENRTKQGRQAQRQRYGSSANWAAATAKLLRDHGFNGTGAWTDDEALQSTGGGLVYTRLWSFMSAYGRKRGGTYQKPGHTGYPGDCPFIFDPAFAVFCEEYAQQLTATKDDPWLLGHFTDNELPWNRKMLENYLSLPAGDAGREAAEQWLRERHGPDATAKHVNDQDRGDFLEFAADRYFSVVAAAIRKHDPNHMVLGTRFHGGALKLPEVFRAAGRHVDVVSVNYYHAWAPDQEWLQSWSAASGKPVMITEWYAKAVDSGMVNKGGAGWLLRNQTDRGMFYQNFTLGLLESPACVGWHWFKYQDNDPDDWAADPSNRDSNKGIMTNRYKEYPDLLAAMRELNTRSYGLIRHFDSERRNAAFR
jgi:hypothetical protein